MKVSVLSPFFLLTRKFLEKIFGQIVSIKYIQKVKWKISSNTKMKNENSYRDENLKRVVTSCVNSEILPEFKSKQTGILLKLKERKKGTKKQTNKQTNKKTKLLLYVSHLNFPGKFKIQEMLFKWRVSEKESKREREREREWIFIACTYVT